MYELVTCRVNFQTSTEAMNQKRMKQNGKQPGVGVPTECQGQAKPAGSIQYNTEWTKEVKTSKQEYLNCNKKLATLDPVRLLRHTTSVVNKTDDDCYQQVATVKLWWQSGTDNGRRTDRRQ